MADIAKDIASRESRGTPGRIPEPSDFLTAIDTVSSWPQMCCLLLLNDWAILDTTDPEILQYRNVFAKDSSLIDQPGDPL